jgi:hypothetical protein
MFQSHERWLAKGSGRVSEKRRPRACQGTVGVCIRIMGCMRGEIGPRLDSGRGRVSIIARWDGDGGRAGG